MRISPIGTSATNYLSTIIKVNHETASVNLIDNVRVSYNFLTWDYLSDDDFSRTIHYFYIAGKWQRTINQWSNSMHIPFIPSEVTAFRISPNAVGRFDENNFVLTLTHNPSVDIEISIGEQLIGTITASSNQSRNWFSWAADAYRSGNNIYYYQDGNWVFYGLRVSAFYLQGLPFNATHLRIASRHRAASFDDETNILTLQHLSPVDIEIKVNPIQRLNDIRYLRVVDAGMLAIGTGIGISWNSNSWRDNIYFYQNGNWNFGFGLSLSRFNIAEIPKDASRIRIAGADIFSEFDAATNTLILTRYDVKDINIVRNYVEGPIIQAVLDGDTLTFVGN